MANVIEYHFQDQAVKDSDFCFVNTLSFASLCLLIHSGEANYYMERALWQGNECDLGTIVRENIQMA